MRRASSFRCCLPRLSSAVDAMRMRRGKEAAEAELREQRNRFEALAAERAMLLREVNHRVGNSLQLIAAFLQLQAGGAKTGAGQGRAHRRDAPRDGGRPGAQAPLHIQRRSVGVGRSISRGAGRRSVAYRRVRNVRTQPCRRAAGARSGPRRRDRRDRQRTRSQRDEIRLSRTEGPDPGRAETR